jgi:hypothetical protein
VRIATNGFAAVAIIGKKLGLVAYSDLAHLDPRLEDAGQVLHQLAKIDALLREIIEDNSFTAVNQLDVNQIHLKPASSDQFLTRNKGRRAIGINPGFVLAIIGRRSAQNLATRGVAHVPGRAFRYRAEDFADLGAPISSDHNVVTASVSERRRVSKLA